MKRTNKELIQKKIEKIKSKKNEKSKRLNYFTLA